MTQQVRKPVAATQRLSGRDLEAFITPVGLAAAETRQVWSALEPAMPDILRAFYDAIAKTPQVSAKLGDRAHEDRLKSAQLNHWRYIFNHDLDIETEGQAIKIGEAHLRVGLDTVWMIAAFGRLINEAIPVVTARHRFSRTKMNAALQAMVSRFFVDLALSQSGFEQAHIRHKLTSESEASNFRSLQNVATSVSDINQIAVNMAVLARNTRQATNGGQGISAAAAQLVSSIEQIATNSDGAAREAEATNDAAMQGLSAMSAVSQAITHIAQTSEEAARSLAELNSASEQISEFLAVIESIASQTNLLALNATIEAARAGESGRGFAVVASEVKSLASQTAKATEDISRRIAALREGMTTIQTAMTSARDAVTQGQGAIDGANHLIQSVGDQVSTVSARMQEITGILQQQKAASAEIAASTAAVAGIANENERRLMAVSDTLQMSNDKFSDNAKTWFQADSARSLCQMAKIDHVLFKKKVVDTLLGRVNWRADEVPDHHHCRLGKWYDAITNEDIRRHPAFKALEAPHLNVHAAAKATLSAHAAGDYEGAFKAVMDMDLASQRVLQSLDALASALSDELADADKRREARQNVEGVADLRGGDATRQVRIVNRSNGGLGAEGIQKEDVGRTLGVVIDGAERLGEAVWSDGARGGIRFLTG
ncbi:MAG: methyl-accepting chemotaxis protein [Asticcacaulis sp.]|uniref:methyl-accepting chemotaxis protein n=1 Tax=Asticcacaulis sp. TaxID=1872648 RepID=UPI003F7B8E52